MNGLFQDLQHVEVGDSLVWQRTGCVEDSEGDGVREQLMDIIVYHGHLWQRICASVFVSAPTWVPVNVQQPLQFLKLHVSMFSMFSP